MRPGAPRAHSNLEEAPQRNPTLRALRPRTCSLQTLSPTRLLATPLPVAGGVCWKALSEVCVCGSESRNCQPMGLMELRLPLSNSLQHVLMCVLRERGHWRTPLPNPADVGSETLTLKGLNRYGQGFMGPLDPGSLTPAPSQHLRHDMWPQKNDGGGRGAQRPAGLSLNRKTGKWGAPVCSPWHPKAPTPLSRCLPQPLPGFFASSCLSVLYSLLKFTGDVYKKTTCPRQGLALLLRGCGGVSPAGGH